MVFGGRWLAAAAGLISRWRQTFYIAFITNNLFHGPGRHYKWPFFIHCYCGYKIVSIMIIYSCMYRMAALSELKTLLIIILVHPSQIYQEFYFQVGKLTEKLKNLCKSWQIDGKIEKFMKKLVRLVKRRVFPRKDFEDPPQNSTKLFQMALREF